MKGQDARPLRKKRTAKIRAQTKKMTSETRSYEFSPKSNLLKSLGVTFPSQFHREGFPMELLAFC